MRQRCSAVFRRSSRSHIMRRIGSLSGCPFVAQNTHNPQNGGRSTQTRLVRASSGSTITSSLYSTSISADCAYSAGGLHGKFDSMGTRSRARVYCPSNGEEAMRNPGDERIHSYYSPPLGAQVPSNKADEPETSSVV